MPQTKPRTYVGLLAVLIGTTLFLLVEPAVEQEAHLRVVRNGEGVEVTEALRRLCWIRSGVEGLDELLTTLPFEHRAEILRHADELGCLGQLQPEHRATYALMMPDDVDRAAGFAEHAIGPAIELISSEDPQLAERAAHALTVLEPRLSPAQRERIISELAQRPPSQFCDQLRAELGVTAPLPVRDAGATAADVGLDATPSEPDMGTEPEPRGRDMGTKPRERLVPALTAPQLGAPHLGVVYQKDEPAQVEPVPAAEEQPQVEERNSSKPPARKPQKPLPPAEAPDMGDARD